MRRNYEMLRRRADEEPHQIEVSSLGQKPKRSPGFKRAQSGNEDLDFDLHLVLHAILRRRRWIYICMGTFVSAAVLACVFMTRQYQAESMIEVLKQNADPVSATADPGAAANADPLDFSVSLQTQLAVLNSDRLAWQVLKQQKLLNPADIPEPEEDSSTRTDTTSDVSSLKPGRHAAELLNQFKRKLTVSSIPGTRLIHVSYLDPDPQRAAEIVNQLVSDFLEYTFQVQYEATRNATDWLSKQLVELKSQVEEAQKHAAELQRQSGIFGEDEHHNIVLTRLEQLNNELTAAEADRVMKENVYRLSRSGNPELVANLIGSQVAGMEGGATLLLNSLRQQEATVNAQYADAAAKYGPAYPRLIQLKDQLSSIRSSIDFEIAKLGQRAKSNYEVSAAREASARDAFNRQKTAAAEMNDKATNYLIAKQEADSSQQLYQHLLHQVKEAGVLAGLHSGNVHVLDRASVPTRPARPQVPLYLGAATLAGILAGFSCVFIAEALDRTVRDVGEIEADTFVPVLGVIPQAGSDTGGALRRRLAGRQQPHHDPANHVLETLHDAVISEAFRSVRNSLLLSHAAPRPKVLLVTSGLQQEGKTFSSLHLAAVLARKAGRTLLIDADLRCATLTRVLGKESEVGLNEILEGKTDVIPGFHDVDELSGVTFMPAGAGGFADPELLENPRMSALLEYCREQFDYVVLDTPPVLLVADAIALAPYADTAVIVVRAAGSTRDRLLRTVRTLQGVHPGRLGILVNGINAHSGRYDQYLEPYGQEGYLRGSSGGGRVTVLPGSGTKSSKESA